MSAIPSTSDPFDFQKPALPPSGSRYELAFVVQPADVEQVQRLRYRVFNLELDEGLEASHQTGLDRDAFDPFCHHLMVRDRSSGSVVGTYRMQTQQMALAGAGFYSAGEFDLSGFPDGLLASALEIGRACIAAEHRNLKVLYLLWQGLGRYMSHNRLRYLFGCCSLTSQDPHEATRVYRRLKEENGLDPEIHVAPLDSHACLLPNPDPGPDHMPRLMRTYLSLGARICSEPAIDRDFGTIDYLALFDLGRMEPARLAFFQCGS